MPLVRLGLIFAPILILTALILQNQSPRLDLVFLSLRSQPLPFGLWLAIAIALGGLTSGLLKLLLQAPQPQQQAPRQAPKQAQRHPQQPRTPASSARRPARPPASDWQAPPSNDWGSPREDGTSPPPPRTPAYSEDIGTVAEERSSRAQAAPPPRKPKAQPTSSGRPGKSVFDAEYRVVNPPNTPDNSADWDEFDDDFFDEE